MKKIPILKKEEDFIIIEKELHTKVSHIKFSVNKKEYLLLNNFKEIDGQFYSSGLSMYSLDDMSLMCYTPDIFVEELFCENKDFIIKMLFKYSFLGINCKTYFN